VSDRPELAKNLSAQEFRNWYWYKKELIKFCSQHGLKTTGGKIELAARIEHFLKTGEHLPEKAPTKKKIHKKNSVQKLPQDINEPIPENYTSSTLYRKYFESIIGPHFHYTVYMMNYMKKHPGITFKKYVDEWIAEHERRKNKNYKPPIQKSCEYNQYTRDFFTNNPDRKRDEAIACWTHKKSLPGSNKYSKNDLKILQKK